jgi:hypothetical protein
LVPPSVESPLLPNPGTPLPPLPHAIAAPIETARTGVANAAANAIPLDLAVRPVRHILVVSRIWLPRVVGPPDQGCSLS